MADDREHGTLRLAELIAALSLATDVGLGQPMEYLLHTCLLAVELGRTLGMPQADLQDVYYVALRRWIGCTGHAHEAAELFGDEIAARARLALLDPGRPGEMLSEGLRHIYTKIGVSTRGAAALFAMQHDLVQAGGGEEGGFG